MNKIQEADVANVATLLKEYIKSGRSDEGRNEVFLQILPYIDSMALHFAKDSCADSNEVDDLLSTVHLGILSKWMPRMKIRRGGGAVWAYLVFTIRGLVHGFFAARRFPAPLEYKTSYCPIDDINYQLDRGLVLAHVHELSEEYSDVRGRGRDIGGVIEGVIEARAWKEYEESGRLY